MSTHEIARLSKDAIEEHIRKELDVALRSKNQRIFSKIAMAAMSSIPWVGGFLSTAADLSVQDTQWQVHQLYWQWFEVHRQKMNLLGQTLVEMIQRLESLEDVEERLQSREYLKFVSQGFRLWDRTESDQTRRLVQRLLIHAADNSHCSDAILGLFFSWLARFDDSHLTVIRTLQQSKQLRQSEIWYQIFGNENKSSAAEGVFFQRLMQELMTERVTRIRQFDQAEKSDAKLENNGWSFELIDTDQTAPEKTRVIELTELGLQFVHHAMSGAIPRIQATTSD